jgi:hypothetical protein
MLRLAPGQPAPKRLPALLASLARHTFVVARRPSAACGAPAHDEPAAKRRAGLFQHKMRLAENALAAAGAGGPARVLVAEGDGPAAADVAAWAGGGAPLPQTDPACIVCFVSIPGEAEAWVAG